MAVYVGLAHKISIVYIEVCVCDKMWKRSQGIILLQVTISVQCARWIEKHAWAFTLGSDCVTVQLFVLIRVLKHPAAQCPASTLLELITYFFLFFFTLIQSVLYLHYIHFILSFSASFVFHGLFEKQFSQGSSCKFPQSWCKALNHFRCCTSSGNVLTDKSIISICSGGGLAYNIHVMKSNSERLFHC